jgi:hypothetical protein
MSTINIDKNITPGDKVIFQVSMDFYGYGETREFSFTAPAACPQVNKLNNIYLNTKQLNDVKVPSKPYSFSKYIKSTKVDKNNYRLKIYMDSLKNANELKPGEKVRLVSSNSRLAQLTNREYIIIKPDNNSSNPRYVHLKVNNNYQPTQVSGNANGTLTEGSVTVKQKRIRVTVPESVFKGLVKKVVPGSPKKGDVDDIIVYAYKQFEGKNSAAIKKKLMVNDNEVNEKTPPSKSAVNDYRKNPSYSKDFKLEQNKTILCYISIARYTYNGTSWEGEWLQTNQLGQAIWGRAVPKESN